MPTKTVRMTKEEKITRARQLRDAAVDRVSKEGVWEPVGVNGNQIRVRGIDRGPLYILYTTPFQKLPREFAETDKYLAVLNDIKLPMQSGFMLDVWDRRHSRHKVFSVAWNDDTLEVASFHRGEWENELIAV